MKVLLITNYEPDGQNSMLAFRRVLERELPATGCEVRVLTPSRRLFGLPLGRRMQKWLAYIDKFVLFLPALVRQTRWADVVHVTDHSNAMYVRWVRAKPNLVTCHDVIAIRAGMGLDETWQVGWTGRQFQRLISRGLTRADLVACVSELTRRELEALSLVDPRRVETVSNGLNDDFAPVAPAVSGPLLARFGIDPQAPYLLHVGSNLSRKNRGAVVESFIALQQRAAAAGTEAIARQLVFVGPALDAPWQKLLAASGLADRVRVIDGVSHEELRALYAAATLLVFPSLQEGFGWPVIEAQACGCPVVTSDLAPMNEIGGPGAVYVDPRDPQAIAAAIESAAPRLAELRRLGLESASRYSAAQMALNYKAAYDDAVRLHGPLA